MKYKSKLKQNSWNIHIFLALYYNDFCKMFNFVFEKYPHTFKELKLQVNSMPVLKSRKISTIHDTFSLLERIPSISLVREIKVSFMYYFTGMGLMNEENLCRLNTCQLKKQPPAPKRHALYLQLQHVSGSNLIALLLSF